MEREKQRKKKYKKVNNLIDSFLPSFR
jgi:hypothetical protein